MQLRTSEKKRAKIKMALQGCAGSGKTYSSLLLAKSLSNNDFTKVAVIDTENGSADLYAHLGKYNVITLQPPFTPEVYIEAIELCEKAGMLTIVIDSISHCWDYILECHSNMTGNSFTNWGRVKPRHKAFIDKILQSDCNIIATMRTKQEYVLNQKDGKIVPEKVGLKAVQSDGVDYEFTIVLDIDIKHIATASKDRTGLFMGKPEFMVNPDTGRLILDWSNDGVTVDIVRKQIQEAKTLEELSTIYHQHPEWYQLLTPDFMSKKADLQKPQSPITQTPVPNQPNLIRYGSNFITNPK